MSASYLEHIYHVTSCDMDMWGYLKPTVILNICQEVAYMHSTQMGFGYERLQELNAAWVLSRVKVEVERLPVWHEKIRVRTWHKRQSGLFALRDYIFFDAEDKPIIKVTTSWLIINLATRRISRVDRILPADDAYNLTAYDHDAIVDEAERVELPEQGVACAEHTVVYSDVDINRHVNNAKYLEWACDLSEQLASGSGKLSHFCINFNHEALLDETISLATVTPSADKLIAEGKIDGRSIFTVAMSFAN